MSSNDCDNYFGLLSKFSHGKRIYFGQTDSWQAYQLMVAGLRSDKHFEDKIQTSAGIVPSHVRDVNTQKLVDKQVYDQKRKKTEGYKNRRRVSQYTKIKDAVKNSTASARHCPNKLSPTDSCKSKAEKGPLH